MRTPDSLHSLVDHGIIDEVVRPLMSGKEAQVYLVVSGGEQRVAKIYKEAQNRSFQNRADYTEGRKVRNSRDQRAMGRGSRHGKAQNEAAWRSAEVDMIYRLRDAGVKVPTPYHFIDGVLIMELVTDAEGFPAPRLGDLVWTPEDAEQLFRELLGEVVRMLSIGVVHGDLSDFNVLMGAAGPVVIDFPQSVDASTNANARKLLLRDVDNLHRFASKFAPLHAALPYAQEMWELYKRNALTPDTQLTGRFKTAHKPADTEAVLGLISDATKDERRRREGLGMSMRGVGSEPVASERGQGREDRGAPPARFPARAPEGAPRPQRGPARIERSATGSAPEAQRGAARVERGAPGSHAERGPARVERAASGAQLERGPARVERSAPGAYSERGPARGERAEVSPSDRGQARPERTVRDAPGERPGRVEPAPSHGRPDADRGAARAHTEPGSRRDRGRETPQARRETPLSDARPERVAPGASGNAPRSERDARAREAAPRVERDARRERPAAERPAAERPAAERPAAERDARRERPSAERSPADPRRVETAPAARGTPGGREAPRLERESAHGRGDRVRTDRDERTRSPMHGAPSGHDAGQDRALERRRGSFGERVAYRAQPGGGGDVRSSERGGARATSSAGRDTREREQRPDRPDAEVSKRALPRASEERPDSSKRRG